MNDTTLVIMAAGIGSRYGAGIKQLQKVGRCGELIIDYSIHDALEAGFNKVVIILRKDIEDEFKEVIGTRIEKICPVEYVVQSRDDLPEGFVCPPDRVKPWGTGQAILACRGIVQDPFVIINADDYYGKEAFHKVYAFLNDNRGLSYKYCMAGFQLANTISDSGVVTRGICQMNEQEYLVKVTETSGIGRDVEGVARSAAGEAIPEDALVSMNMWGVTPEFIDTLQDMFVTFLEGLVPGDIKTEFLLPDAVDNLLQSGKASVKVLSTLDKWFGITYAEDKPVVVDAFNKLIEAGVYEENLWGVQ